MELKEQTTVSADKPSTEEKTYKCKWLQCLGSEEKPRKNEELHEVEPIYPNNGNVTKKKRPSVKEPWEPNRPGTENHPDFYDYFSDFNVDTDDTRNLAGDAFHHYPHPTYPTQKHHLIPAELFKNYGTLSANCKLIGYDMNHENNGLALPTYTVDIVQHDLQRHNGSHPGMYNSMVANRLSAIDEDCAEYCFPDRKGTREHQQRLIRELNALSRRAEYAIRAWRWLLRSNALEERERSKRMLAKNLKRVKDSQ